MEIYKNRRSKLAKSLPEDSVAIIHSSSHKIRNGDTEYAFRQDSDFFYLTGFEEPDSALIVKNLNGEESILFCREKDTVKEKWEGPRLGPENSSVIGIENGYGIDKLLEQLTLNLDGAKNLFSQRNSKKKIFFSLNRIMKSSGTSFNLKKDNIKDIEIYLHEMRLFKETHEINLMEKACEISSRAHERAMKKVSPGMYEYQLEAEYLFEFMNNGARNTAYPSIVGGGQNGCILHYNENADLLNDGELVLVDAGCEYKGYASDITRTFPINGKFSPEQKLIYEIVLESQKKSIKSISEKSNPFETHKTSVEVIVDGLLDIGLLKGSKDEVMETQSYSKFYMHRVGHWLGLDVHDVGGYEKGGKLRSYKNGMITTIEPGIYINKDEDVPNKFKGIGVRIEDDVLIENNQPKVLSTAVKEIDDIQHLMASQ